MYKGAAAISIAPEGLTLGIDMLVYIHITCVLTLVVLPLRWSNRENGKHNNVYAHPIISSHLIRLLFFAVGHVSIRVFP